MEANIRDFMLKVSAEELERRSILLSHAGDRNLLMGARVEPLLELMRDRSITRLTFPDRSWHLAADGDFANPESREIKEGNFREMEHRGNVFQDQNTSINPFYSPEQSQNY